MADRYFILQWHLTAECDYRCQHCYMLDEESYFSEMNHALPYERCITVIDDFVEMTNALSKKFSKQISPMIHFSGGDPLLRKDFYKILSYANNKNIKLGILGNPTLINPVSAAKLKDHGVLQYQVSLDGLKNTHDELRKKGSFDQTIQAIHFLQEAGIETHVMFSLSKKNKDDLIPLVDLMIQKRIDKFAFARVSSVGKGQNLDSSISPQEYREFLLTVHEVYRRYEKQDVHTKLVLKDHLWVLLHYELGLFKPNGHSNNISGGCGIGISFLVLLADGTVYACRRFPSPVGKVPKEKLVDLFLNSKKLNHYRQFEKFDKCAKCELLNYCRGCPAVSYGHSDNSFAPDPQCWKEVA